MREGDWMALSGETAVECGAGSRRSRLEALPALPSPLFWLAALLVIATVAVGSSPRSGDAVEEGHPEKSSLHASRIDGVAFSPDGERVATAGSDGTIMICNLTTTQACQIGCRASKGFFWVAFSPVGRTIAVGDLDGRLALADSRDGRMSFASRTISAGYPLRCGVFSPDGGSLAIGGDDRVIRIWDMRTGLESLAATGHLDMVRGLAYTPDGDAILSVAADGSAILRDVRTGHIRKRCDAKVGPLWSVAISPDGRWAALGGKNQITLWSLVDERSIVHTNCEGTIASLAFLPSGTMLASAGLQCPTRLWRWEGGVLQPSRTLEGHTGHVKAMAVSPDGRVLAAGDGEGTLNVWRL